VNRRLGAVHDGLGPYRDVDEGVEAQGELSSMVSQCVCIHVVVLGEIAHQGSCDVDTGCPRVGAVHPRWLGEAEEAV
jgi:hypothetical protein